MGSIAIPPAASFAAAADAATLQQAAGVPMLAPDGHVYSVPQSEMRERLANGGKLALPMRAPSGDLHWVPSEDVPKMQAQGGKVDWSAVPAKHQEGFWSAMGSDLWGMAKGTPSMLPPVMAAGQIQHAFADINELQRTGKSLEEEQYEARRAAGYGPIYSAVTAPLAQAVGVNVPGMEQAAGQGDTAAVLGHGTAPLAVLAAAEAAPKVFPPAKAAAAQAPSAVLDVAEKAPLVGGLVGESREALTAPANFEPEEAAMKAVRARNSIVGAKQKLALALPDARRAADALGIDTSKMTLEDAQAAVARAKQDVWGEYEQRFLGPNQRIGIDTSPVADRINAATKGWTDIRKVEMPERLQDATDRAANYDGQMRSVGEIEQRIQELNNELRSQQSQFKVNEQSLRRDPRFAANFAELDGLRAVESDAFDNLSGPGASLLKQRYGALKVFDDVLDRRINVAERSSPVSLPQAISRIRGIGKIIKGSLPPNWGSGDFLEGLVNLKAGENARLYNDPDYLIQQAFSKTTPRPAPMPAPPSRIAGFLPRGPLITPPPADTSGTVPGASDLINMQAVLNTVRRPLALPERSAFMPPAPEPEAGGVFSAKSVVIRDARTGRMRRMYLPIPK